MSSKLDEKFREVEARMAKSMATAFYPNGREEYVREFERRFGLPPSSPPQPQEAMRK